MAQWEYDGEHKTLYEADDCGYPGVVAWVHRCEDGPRLARLPKLEGLVKRYIEHHDASFGHVPEFDAQWLRREPPGEAVCRCGLCTEARALLGGAP